MLLMDDQISFVGESGNTYTFRVYSKSDSLPDKAGIYILTYSHPRGHLSGFQVNILGVGNAPVLNSVLEELRTSEKLAEQCWNYTCILCLDDEIKRREIVLDLSSVDLVIC